MTLKHNTQHETDEERAVSPVIGVILMVAITVILAAVIAAFVLDLGGSIGEEAQAGVDIEVDESAGEAQIQITSQGNAEAFEIGGQNVDSDDLGEELDGAGSVVTLEGETDGSGWADDSHFEANTGTITVTAMIESDGTSTTVASEDFDFEDWFDEETS